MLPPNEAVDPSGDFQDRKTGLVIFGILTVLMGGLTGLFVPFMMWGQAMAAKAGTPQNAGLMAPVIVIYGGLAIVLVWLGIGSMMARRWARALLLIFSWSWLIMGVASMGMMALMLPHIMQATNAGRAPGQPALPASANALIMVIPMIIMGVMFILIPGAWILFYRSRNVKATCEARNPVLRWTDRCPLPVIAACLWLAFSSVMMLLSAVSYKGVLPVFGTFIVGPLGMALYVLLAWIWGYAAWAFYKLDRRGWWLIVASFTLFAISAFITYSRHDVSEIFTLMGYPKEQLVQMNATGLFQGRTMAWFSLIGMAPFLGYLLYVRRFFVRP